ncbi:MAG: ATP-binding protein, partial [Vicinamibacterales bacterium]
RARIGVCLTLTRAIGQARTVEELYGIALDALREGLGVERSSILLFDPDGVMRFKAYRGLSEAYRRAVEGHTPWRPDSPDPRPIVVADVSRDEGLAALRPAVVREGIAAMAFVPLVSEGRVIGKFMLYFDRPYAPGADELEFADLIASQVAFAVERTRAEAQARLSEARLRFALDAAAMGTWEWDLRTQSVRWSVNLERLHGLPAGTFDGAFGSYEKEIHPDDRAHVAASVQRAIEQGVPHDIEYRIVGPDGTIRWCEGKGRVEYEDGRPVRMTGVCMMITERKEVERLRLESAEEASRLKDEFLAMLSHELRTPLNAVLGWVQILQSGRLSPARIQQAIDIIGRNATLQSRLIEDILDLSRIIAGKLDVERVPVSLAGVVETVVSGARPEVAARGLTLTVDVEPRLPPIDGDPRRLHQVVGNVLANAVKFTPAGGRIAVSARTAGTAVELVVQDSGVGIQPEFLPFVFDRFRQADSGATRQHGGLGLGLAICRHLVERHGGEIAAASDGIGRGTTVRIRLPIGRDGVAGADVRPVDHAPLDGERLDDHRVVVVDDQSDSREILAALLSARGAEVVECASAAHALEALKRQSADLLVADIAMPEVDGLELIRRARELQPDLPAVAVSAYARPEDRARALAAGFRGYCTKPLEHHLLLQTVREALTPEGRTADQAGSPS